MFSEEAGPAIRTSGRGGRGRAAQVVCRLLASLVENLRMNYVHLAVRGYSCSWCMERCPLLVAC